MTRKEAREFAMQTIYSIDLQKDYDNLNIEKYIGDKKLGSQKEYFTKVVTLVFSNLEEIDNDINKASDGWPVRRMGKTDLAVIRLAVAEMKYLDDVPKAVAVNEAIELAKLYGTDNSQKFVNAVLGKIDDK